MFKFKRIMINKKREKATGAAFLELSEENDKKELFKSISSGFIGTKALPESVLREIVELSGKYNNLLFDDYKKATNPKNRLEQDFMTALRIFEVIYSSDGNFWLIEDRNGKIAGFFYIYDIISLIFPKKTKKEGEIIYEKKPWCAVIAGCLKREFWGINSKKIFKKILSMLFEEENYKKIKCEIFASNPYVRGILKHFNFENEGILKEETLNRGKPENVEIWALHAKNWEKNKKNILINS